MIAVFSLIAALLLGCGQTLLCIIWCVIGLIYFRTKHGKKQFLKDYKRILKFNDYLYGDNKYKN